MESKAELIKQLLEAETSVAQQKCTVAKPSAITDLQKRKHSHQVICMESQLV